jgi:hypothetical protein
MDFKLAMRMSAESSYTTHPGPIAAAACAFLGYLIARAITRPQNSKESAAQFLDACVADYSLLPEAAGGRAMARLLRGAEPQGSPERCWNWRDPEGPYLLETVAARGADYNGYPVQKDYFGSYAMDGLAIALFSMYHTTTFMAALARCVNLLGDADSTGAILGQIAGAFYGIDRIDGRLIDRLRKWDDSEVALRGALLYTIGCDLSETAKGQALQSRGLDPGWESQDEKFEKLVMPKVQGVSAESRASKNSSKVAMQESSEYSSENEGSTDEGSTDDDYDDGISPVPEESRIVQPGSSAPSPGFRPCEYGIRYGQVPELPVPAPRPLIPASVSAQLPGALTRGRNNSRKTRKDSKGRKTSSSRDKSRGKPRDKSQEKIRK